jgi:hypothetical protein
MTTSGIARSTPRQAGCRVMSWTCVSTSTIASTTEATNTAGSERKPASSPIASTGTISSIRFGADSGICSGASSTPASPASAAPSVQAPAATRSGDQPNVAAARGFSVTAVAASPIVVCRNSAHSAVSTAATRASRTKTSQPTGMPASVTFPVGRTVGALRTGVPYMSVNADCRMISRPSVAMTRVSAEPSRMGRMTSTLKSRPMSAVDATARKAANPVGRPHTSAAPWNV